MNVGWMMTMENLTLTDHVSVNGVAGPNSTLSLIQLRIPTRIIPTTGMTYGDPPQMVSFSVSYQPVDIIRSR